MCLGVPGRVVEIFEKDEMPMGRVDFGGIQKEICLSYTPEVQVDDFVLVHVGFAISVIDEQEAAETVELINQIAEAGKEEEREREGSSEVPGAADPE